MRSRTIQTGERAPALWDTIRTGAPGPPAAIMQSMPSALAACRVECCSSVRAVHRRWVPVSASWTAGAYATVGLRLAHSDVVIYLTAYKRETYGSP